MSAVVVVLVVAATLLCYAQPLADDFARACKGHAQGILLATRAEYLHWSGRWVSCSLDYLLTSSFDLVRLYPLLLLINPLLLALSIYLLLRAAKVGAALRQRLWLTAAGLALYWVGMPHPGENIYWLTGGVDNLGGLSLSLLLFAGLLQTKARTRYRSFVMAIGLALLAVVATGFHELFAFLLCIALAGGTLEVWLARDQQRWTWTACLVAALVGLSLVYVAPGNAIRRAEFPFAANVGVTVRLTIQEVAANIIPWVLDLRLIFGTALLFMLALRSVEGPTQSHRTSARDLVIVAITWIVLIGSAFAAASWATGSRLILRTLDGIYLIFLTGWFWVFVMTVRHFRERGKPLAFATPLVRRMAVIIFVAAMLLTGNTWKAVADLRWAAHAYSAAMQQRWRSLRSFRAQGASDGSVEPLPARPQSYVSYFELRDDPNYWENRSVACYFGLHSVRLIGNKRKSIQRDPFSNGH